MNMLDRNLYFAKNLKNSNFSYIVTAALIFNYLILALTCILVQGRLF